MRDEQKGMDAVKEDMQRMTEIFKDKVRKLTDAAVTVTKGIGGVAVHCQDRDPG